MGQCQLDKDLPALVRLDHFALKLIDEGLRFDCTEGRLHNHGGDVAAHVR